MSRNPKDNTFSIIFRYRNKIKAKKMVRAWKSFLSEKLEFDEESFTKFFISSIDYTIQHNDLEFAITLSQLYVHNIEKRSRFLIAHKILPKVFEWNETLWNKRQQKTNSKIVDSLDWDYYCREFFQSIITTLLKNRNVSYQLFSSFKKHVEESEKKLDKIEDEKQKEEYSDYIKALFAYFCPTFFNEIDKAPSDDKIWNNYFPKEWKISMANIKNRIPHIILNEFLKWSQYRILKKAGHTGVDKNLTSVISGIFPNVCSSLFTVFLMLYSSSNIKDALEREPNFFTSNKPVVDMSSPKEDDETIQVIFHFFHSWPPLTIYKDDLSEKEIENREHVTEEERKSIVKRVQRKKLEDIKEICKSSKENESYRKTLLELIELLLLKIEK